MKRIPPATSIPGQMHFEPSAIGGVPVFWRFALFGYFCPHTYTTFSPTGLFPPAYDLSFPEALNQYATEGQL